MSCWEKPLPAHMPVLLLLVFVRLYCFCFCCFLIQPEGPAAGSPPYFPPPSYSVDTSGTVSSRASSMIRTVSREVNMVTPFWTAHWRISMPSW